VYAPDTQIVTSKHFDGDTLFYEDENTARPLPQLVATRNPNMGGNLN
jgi:hypothetical protein